MSKALGNFFTVRDLLEQGVPGEVIRFVFLQTHYRKPMDWTAEKAREAQASLRKWAVRTYKSENGLPDPRVVEALADDLNTARAISIMHELAKNEQYGALLGSALLLGLNLKSPNLVTEGDVLFAGMQVNHNAMVDGIHAQNAEYLRRWRQRLLDERARAMETKDFAEVDLIKKMLIDAGVEVRMSKTDVVLRPGSDFDLGKLESLK